MTDRTQDPVGGVASAAAVSPTSAGGMLRAAREAAGMSLDAVAQQLKLAPRQVAALEEDDYASLPGRTFVRGFLRNYARLVRIDPDKVLLALSGGDTPSLDSPALHPTAPTMGELPTADRAKPGWTRWVIPLILVAIIATAAVYEYMRSRGDAQHPPATPPAASEPQQGVAPAPPAPVVSGTPLPNPVASPSAPAESAAKESAGGAEKAAPAAPPAPGTAASAVPGATEATLVLTFRDAPWTEVKDGAGRVLLAQMFAAGQTRTVSGVPPLDVVIGNANEATATYRGRVIDLAPYTRQNVARLILQ